ncbi:hypothetical protein Tco_1145868 [Tanacetum coccineum]
MVFILMKASFVEETLIMIVGHEVKRLKQSRIPLVKVASDDLRDALSVIFGLSELKKTQRQSWNEDSRLDDLRRNEAHRALSDVRGGRSTRLTPPALVPTVDKADGMILQDTLQVTLAEYKSREEQEARENVDCNNALSSDPRSDFFKDSPEVKITNNEEVEITNVVIPINVNEEEEEITDEVYELKQREKGKIVEESRSTPSPTPIRSPRIHTDLVSSDTKKLQELTVTDTTPTPSSISLYTKSYRDVMEVTVESLPTMVDNHIKEQVKKQVPEQERGKLQAKISSQIQQAIDINIPSLMKFETFQVSQTTYRTSAVCPRDQDDPHDDAHPEGKNSAKWQKTSYSGPEKIVLSLHKFHAIIFNDVDIEERTSRWAERAWKTKEVVYSNSKIIQVIKTYWELGHEHKFITEIIARRANECIVSITEPVYKNLNKNDIEDIYLLIMNGMVPDYAETGIEKHKMFSIIYEPVHGIIYKNSKKEKKVMRHSEIHKFCDATLNRVLEGLKSFNNDFKYGYIQRDLIEDEVEYLKLFREEIEVRLKYHNQMRRWEMYVNGRPLGPQGSLE